MKRILAIDDTLSNLELIKAVLVRQFPDCEILTARSGKEGIEVAREVLPETILLDILMPDMDGFETCMILKMDSTTKHIPILMVSALGQDPEHRIKGLNLGADAFISKPFDRAELTALVNVMLRIKQAEDILKKRNENLELLINKQTKEFLKSENRFLQISEYVLEFFWEVDASGMFTYISPVIEKILGYQNDEILGVKYLYDFIQPNEDRKTKLSLLKVFRKRDKYKDVEILCLHKDGNKVWLALSGFPIFDQDEKFIGYRGVSHDITTRRQAELALEDSLNKIKNYQKKLKKLNSELISVEEQERRRIAEYLLDGLGQTLSIAYIKISYLLNKEVSDEVRSTLEEALNFINIAVVNSRLLTYDLSPPILYELGLLAAIKWKLDQFEDEYNISTKYVSPIDEVNFDNNNNILIYRIISELLTNIIKHAEASLIEISIHKDERYFYFTVGDNGKGFNYDYKSDLSEQGGFGLFSIHERLESIMGGLEIKTESQMGTKVIVNIPI